MNSCPKCNLRRETPLSESCPLCGFTVRTLYTHATPRRPKSRREQQVQAANPRRFNARSSDS